MAMCFSCNDTFIAIKLILHVPPLTKKNRCMRENAEETLIANGTQFLNENSIEAIICDQEMDVDETTMFKILSDWVKQDESNIDVGKRLVSHIQLCYIKPNHLKYVVKKCAFVAAADVDAALKEIEDALVNESLDNKEQVLVTGAGQESVNGIYVRLEEDIGLGSEDVMFVKEGDFDSGCGADYNLFLLRSTWAIATAFDNSSHLYSCEITEGSILPRPPEGGWQSAKGEDPPPTCAWSPSKAKAGKLYVAPEISCSVCSGTRNSITNGDHDEGLQRQITLRTMMALPVDEEYLDEDYPKYPNMLSVQEDARRLLSESDTPSSAKQDSAEQDSAKQNKQIRRSM